MRHLFNDIILLAFVLVFAACGSETDEAWVKTVPIKVTATLGSRTSDGTRVAIAGSNSGVYQASWQNDDQVVVVYGGQCSTLTIDDISPQGMATFAGTISTSTTPTANSLLKFYTDNHHLTVNANDGSWSYSDEPSGTTINDALARTVYYAECSYGDLTSRNVRFYPQTCILRFQLTAPSTATANATATVTYTSTAGTSSTPYAVSGTTTFASGKATACFCIPVDEEASYHDASVTVTITTENLEETGHTYTYPLADSNATVHLEKGLVYSITPTP